MDKEKTKKKKNKISKRKNLVTISYELDTMFPLTEKDLFIEKDSYLTIKKINSKYKDSSLGTIDRDIKESRKKLEDKIEKLSLDIDRIKQRTTDVSPEDKKEILMSFEKRRKKGTINENLDDLTIELSKKVKAIRKATKDAKKILHSSTLQKKDKDDSINLEEYKVLNLPSRSLKNIFREKKVIIFYAIIISLIIIGICALIIVFIV